MTSEIPPKTASFWSAKNQNDQNYSCFICTFEFTEKQYYTEEKNLIKFFSATGYPGRT